MARLRSRRPTRESRDSIAADPRVRFEPVPGPRQLLVIGDPLAFRFPEFDFMGALVWVQDVEGFDPEKFKREAEFACAHAVKVLPREAEAAPLPSSAGSPSLESGPSAVRPVVAELLAELPEAVRAAASEVVERKLSEHGL